MRGARRRSTFVVALALAPVFASIACNAIVGFSSLDKVDTAASGTGARVQDVFLGGGHTCAIMEDTTLTCWGHNNLGQLGVGDTQPHNTPVAVPKLKDVIYVSVGEAHTCIAQSNGDVFCWGSNDSGQLGLGMSGGMQSSPQRLTIDPSDRVQAGLQHTCAQLKSNKVQCWGANAEGELGDGTTKARATPGFVVGIEGANKLSTGGGRHSCVTSLADGGAQVVYCWGLNDKGQLGVPTAMTPSSPLPIMVPGLTGIEKVFVGKEHSCATIKVDTSVTCWGNNESGQLGNSVLGPTSTPTKVEGLANIDALGAGNQFTCAFEQTALQMKCWGSNERGELGRKTTGAGVITTPALVNLANVKGGAAKGDHACALNTAGDLYCWGSNEFGQLGDGLSGIDTSRPEPRRVVF